MTALLALNVSGGHAVTSAPRPTPVPSMSVRRPTRTGGFCAACEGIETHPNARRRSASNDKFLLMFDGLWRRCQWAFNRGGQTTDIGAEPIIGTGRCLSRYQPAGRILEKENANPTLDRGPLCNPFG